MKLSGSAHVPLEPAVTFERLLDPEILARCIPGCQGMERTDEGTYETHVRTGVGPVKGTFKGIVTLSDVVAPERYHMAVKGRSLIGHTQGGAAIRLEPDGEGTTIHYDGEFKVAGRIASVGGRLVQTVARKQARDFFERLAREVAEEG